MTAAKFGLRINLDARVAPPYDGSAVGVRINSDAQIDPPFDGGVIGVRINPDARTRSDPGETNS
jgi:hypothetical protein